MSYYFDFIFGPASYAGRLQRGPKFVTIVEMAGGRYVELDADDVEHGHRLAKVWTDPEHFRGMTASVQRVLPDGSLGGVIGGVVYHEEPWDWPAEPIAA